MKRITLLLAAFILLACSKSEVKDPVKKGDDDKDPVVESTIRVLSYNIHHGAPAGTTAPINLDNIAAVIKAQNPDLVALQEVDRNTNRAGVDQAKVLGSKLGMHYYFSKSINYQNGEFGVAILSKYPIVSTERLVLSNKVAGGEQRTLGVVTVEVPGLGKIKLATAHLDLVLGNREAQVHEINEYSKKSEYPVILAGDLNMTRFDPEFLPLRAEFLLSCTSSCPLTFPADKPTKEIDFIMLNTNAAKKLTVDKYESITGKLESDHLPLLGVISF